MFLILRIILRLFPEGGCLPHTFAKVVNFDLKKDTDTHTHAHMHFPKLVDLKEKAEHHLPPKSSHLSEASATGLSKGDSMLKLLLREML